MPRNPNRGHRRTPPMSQATEEASSSQNPFVLIVWANPEPVTCALVGPRQGRPSTCNSHRRIRTVAYKAKRWMSRSSNTVLIDSAYSSPFDLSTKVILIQRRVIQYV